MCEKNREKNVSNHSVRCALSLVDQESTIKRSNACFFLTVFENLQQISHLLQARVQLQCQQIHAQRSVVLCQITSMPEVASALWPSYETATEHSSSNSNRNTGSLAQRMLQRTLGITVAEGRREDLESR